MDLVPCAACRRHVAALAESCPFCGTARTPLRRALLVQPGRFSRAAVFAGLAACYTNTSAPPSQNQSVPPVEKRRAVGGSSLRGKLTHARTGAPLGGVVVEVWTTASVPTTATTSSSGEFVVSGLEPRDYTVSFVGPDGVRYATSKIVEVRDKETVLDLAFDPVPAPVPKPYGAPPARRRLV